MGFYLRKSLKAGPFRFNFSKSGVGVSVGVKGLRIGTGPRGNYIHAGVGGFYYRASLSPQSQNAPKYNPKYDNANYDDLVEMHEIDSGSVLEMKDSSAKKLVLVVDELDRCRPDYAMKVLEIIKHFFDVEGLFVIIPTNQSALENSLKALYGIDYKNTNIEIKGENYFKKFFTKDKKMPKPDYKALVKDYINKEELSNAFIQGWLKETDNAFNSINILIDKLAEYGSQAQLSLRQMTDICRETIYICNGFYEKIRCEYLAYLICNEERKKKNQKDNFGQIIGINLNNQHPYFVGAHGSMEHNSKRKILDLSIYKTTLNQIQIYGDAPFISFSNYKREMQQQFQSPNILAFKLYKEINDFIELHKSKIQSIQIGHGHPQQQESVKNYKETLIAALIQAEQELKQYQKKWGSDDNDDERKAKYQKIVEQA